MGGRLLFEQHRKFVCVSERTWKKLIFWWINGTLILAYFFPPLRAIPHFL